MLHSNIVLASGSNIRRLESEVARITSHENGRKFWLVAEGIDEEGVVVD